MRAHEFNEFSLVIDSAAGTQPSTSQGTQVTAGSNVYGSWVSILSGASVTDDAYGIWININSVTVSNTATDTLVTIGIDRSGGSTYVDLIPNLACSMATRYMSTAAAGGVWYYFPLFIPAGSSIAAKATQHAEALPVSNPFVYIKLLCQPSRPECLRVGSYVKSFGADTSISGGTSITAGTTSEGNWTQLGSALTETLWFWQLGVTCSSSNVTANPVLHVDLGIGSATNKKITIADNPVMVTSAEMLTATYQGAMRTAVAGDMVYGRAQVSAAFTDFGMIAYGVGG